MSVRIRTLASARALLLTCAGASQAAITGYSDDRTGFLAATTPYAVTLPFNDVFSSAKSVNNPVGIPDMVFSALTFVSGCTPSPTLCSLFFTNAVGTVPGNEMSISGPEDFRLTLSAPVYALGFDIFEPTFAGSADTGGCAGSAATCANSPFTIKVYNGSTLLDTFVYDAPDASSINAPPGFFGIHSDVAFNRIDVIDNSRNSDNEYFGRFLLGLTAPVPPTPGVPEPGSAPLVASALVALAAVLRRRRPSSD